MPNESEYEMEYRCANCGNTYKVVLRKGVTARGAGGQCPKCGVISGKAGVGHHEMTWPQTPLGGKEILHG